jgi:hypothetical protein
MKTCQAIGQRAISQVAAVVQHGAHPDELVKVIESLISRDQN